MNDFAVFSLLLLGIIIVILILAGRRCDVLAERVKFEMLRAEFHLTWARDLEEVINRLNGTIDALKDDLVMSESRWEGKDNDTELRGVWDEPPF